MDIQAIIITCPSDRHELAATVARLQTTDWNSSPHVQIDESTSKFNDVSWNSNVKQALEWFLKTSSSNFVLVLKDCLEFNYFLRWNLERWEPVVTGELHFGSLSSSNISSYGGGETCYDDLAWLISRGLVEQVVHNWQDIVGTQGINLDHIATKIGHALHRHQPSLVQLEGLQTPAYAQDWKAEFSHEQIPGWFSFPRFYTDIVNGARDGDVLVEIGSWMGRSTAFLAQLIKKSKKQVKVLVVDTFVGYATEPKMVAVAQSLGGSVRSRFEENMRLAGVSNFIEVCEAHSVAASSLVPDNSCAMVFIDGDHSYEAVWVVFTPMLN